MYLHGNEESSQHAELFNYQGALRAAEVKTVSAFLGQIFIFRAMWLSQKWSPGLELVTYIRGVSSLTPVSMDSSKQIGNLNVRHHDEVSAAKVKCPPSGMWPPSQRNCKCSHSPFAVFNACQGCCLSEWHSENFLEASRGRYMMKVYVHAGSIKAQLVNSDLILSGTGTIFLKLFTTLILQERGHHWSPGTPEGEDRHLEAQGQILSNELVRQKKIKNKKHLYLKSPKISIYFKFKG